MNGPSYLEQYARAILSGEITAGRRIKQQMRHLLDKIEHPEKYEPYIFDPAVADHHIEFIEKFCKQSQGRRGEPLTLELFQKARLEAIFGFVDKNTGYRQYNEVLIIEGRKNGKTTETAAIELDMLLNDGAGAPEIYNIATRLEQAKKGFVECWNMQRNSTAIRKLVRKRQNDLFCAVNLGFIINLIFAKYNDMYNAGRSIFQGLFDGIAGVWGSIYNWVVEKVNWLSDRLSFWNSSQSKMSANGSHATGLEYVPFDGYRAILHKGERVLTAEQAKEADKGQNGGNTRVVKVEIGQFINQTEKDIDELVEIIDEKLEERREREERV